MKSSFYEFYRSPLSPSLLERLLKKVDLLLQNGQYHHDRPLYQTKGNILIAHPEFSELRKSFLSCVRLYLGRNSESFFSSPLNLVSWVYTNWGGSGFIDNGYHSHNSANPTSISGIYFLSLPEETLSCATRFVIGGNIHYLPPIQGTWFLFPSSLHHQPGRSNLQTRRYTLSADLSIQSSAVARYLQSL